MEEDPTSEVPIWAKRYPPADITPTEFEEWVGELFRTAGDRTDLQHVRVTVTSGLRASMALTTDHCAQHQRLVDQLTAGPDGVKPTRWWLG